VALGIEWNRINPEARTKYDPASCLCVRGQHVIAAWNVKLLAHDSKIARGLSFKSRFPAVRLRAGRRLRESCTVA
jgi:hypothetical protein